MELIHNTDESKYSKIIIKYVGRENATEVPDLTRAGYHPIHRLETFNIDVATSKKESRICVIDIDKICYLDSQWTYYSRDYGDNSTVDKDTPIFEYIGYTEASKSKTNCEIIEDKINELEKQLEASRKRGCAAAAAGGKSRKHKRSKSKRGKTRRNKRRSSRRRR